MRVGAFVGGEGEGGGGYEDRFIVRIYKVFWNS